MADPARPKLSIVTVCRNECARIRQTVDSVLNQSFKDYEFIVVDGGSIDPTVEILSEYKDRFAYFVSEADQGIYNAQNKGLRQAKGEFVLFLNGGDYLARPNVLEKVFTEASDGIDIIYGNLVVVRGDHSELGISPPRITLDFLLSATLWHPVAFIRRGLFEKYGEYDETYRICADYDFFLKVLGVHEVPARHVDVPVTVFNTEGIGSSPQHEGLHQEERRRAQLRYFPRNVIEMHEHFRRIDRDFRWLDERLTVRAMRKVDSLFPRTSRFTGKMILKAWNLLRKAQGRPPAPPPRHWREC